MNPERLPEEGDISNPTQSGLSRTGGWLCLVWQTVLGRRKAQGQSHHNRTYYVSTPRGQVRTSYGALSFLPDGPEKVMVYNFDRSNNSLALFHD